MAKAWGSGARSAGTGRRRRLRALASKYHPASIIMADNIMPYKYFSTVVPTAGEGAARPEDLLRAESEPVARAARAVETRRHPLHPARYRSAVIGIVAPHAQRHDGPAKHRTASRCSGRSDHSGVESSLGIPRRSVPRAYEETLAILPLLHHLQPPSGFAPLRFDRFSPYFDQAEQFGISDMRPYPGIAISCPPAPPSRRWPIISLATTVRRRRSAGSDAGDQ